MKEITNLDGGKFHSYTEDRNVKIYLFTCWESNSLISENHVQFRFLLDNTYSFIDFKIEIFSSLFKNLTYKISDIQYN